MIENENHDSSPDIEEFESSRPSWLSKVEEIANRIAEREGCLLYDLEFNSRTLRVYIDKTSSAGIDDCERVSKALSLELDVENIVPGEHYNLEVSTPGLERILKKTWHFSSSKGKKVKVRTNKSLEALGIKANHLKNTKSFEATIQDVSDDHIVFFVATEVIKIPISSIEKTKVVFEMEKGEKKNSRVKS